MALIQDTNQKIKNIVPIMPMDTQVVFLSRADAVIGYIILKAMQIPRPSSRCSRHAAARYSQDTNWK